MIITVARDEALKRRVVTCLRDTRWSGAVTDVGSVGEAQDLLRRTGAAQVIVVDQPIGLSGAAELATFAESLRPAPAIFVVASPSTNTLRAAMRAGIRDVLAPSFGQDELLRAFEEAGVGSGGPPALPGVTVAVFSTKGGVGTSVIASNLAIRLGELAAVPTTLVDLDLASADQAIMHGLSPRWTIQDLADGTIGADVESLGQVLLTVSGTRARILPGPVDPALAETITPAHVTAVVAGARAEAQVVVVDTASTFDDRTLAVIDLADLVVVVSSLDVAALRSLTVSLQTLQRLGVEHGRIRVALVRSDSKSGLLVSDVERAIDRPVDVAVPSTRVVPRSVNEGVPIAVSAPRSTVVGAVDDLARLVLAAGPEGFLADQGRTEGGGLFPWSRSRGSRGGDDASVADEGPAASPPAPAEPAVEGEVPAVSDVPEDQEGSATVVPMGRGRSTPAARRYRVVRARPANPGPDAAGAADDVADVSVDQDEPDGTAPLSELPPPIVTIDDGDDQPRRRRRR